MMAFLFLLGLPMLASAAWDLRLVGVVWLAGFAWLCRALWLRQRDTSPVVTVDALGLIDRRIMSEGLFWDEIAAIELFETDSMLWVGIEFAGAKQGLEKIGPFTRFFAPLQRLMGLPPVSISMALLDGTAEDLAGAIRAYRPELVVAGRG
jgi:hypothetical protein